MHEIHRMLGSAHEAELERAAHHDNRGKTVKQRRLVHRPRRGLPRSGLFELARARLGALFG